MTETHNSAKHEACEVYCVSYEHLIKHIEWAVRLNVTSCRLYVSHGALDCEEKGAAATLSVDDNEEPIW